MSEVDKAFYYQKLAKEYGLLAEECDYYAQRLENTPIDNAGFKQDAEQHRETAAKYADKAETEMVREELEEIWE